MFVFFCNFEMLFGDNSYIVENNTVSYVY